MESGSGGDAQHVAAMATWSGGRSEQIRTAAELHELLDGAEAQARESGRAHSVELTSLEGAGTLGLVVGHDRSLLTHVPEDGDPPYRVSLGEEALESTFTFYVAGDHHSEVRWENTVPAAVARRAAEIFVADGRLDDAVAWAEV